MIIKATKNCIEKLIVEGASASEIMEMTLSIVLTSVPLFIDHVDRACQVDENNLVDSSLKTLFENYLQNIGCTKSEAQAVVLGLEQERSLIGN